MHRIITFSTICVTLFDANINYIIANNIRLQTLYNFSRFFPHRHTSHKSRIGIKTTEIIGNLSIYGWTRSRGSKRAFSIRYIKLIIFGIISSFLLGGMMWRKTKNKFSHVEKDLRRRQKPKKASAIGRRKFSRKKRKQIEGEGSLFIVGNVCQSTWFFLSWEHFPKSSHFVDFFSGELWISSRKTMSL